jgi:N-acyl homoserine lactone hydrolase
MLNCGITPICTGLVRVKKPFLTRQGGPIISRLRILASQEFTPALPIFAWLIAHPEGDILVDSGMSGGLLRPGYLDSLGRFDAWLSRRLCSFIFKPGDEIGAQLSLIRPSGTQGLRVVMTHLHIDHVDGLSELAGCEILVNEAEWAHPSGAPKALLAPLKPKWFGFKPNGDAIFGLAFPTTRAGDVMAVPTPGHTPNHCSIILRRGGFSYIFAGDAAYNQGQLLSGELAGAHMDARRAADSIGRLKSFAQNNPTVLLPTHDPGAAQRLAENEIVPQ